MEDAYDQLPSTLQFTLGNYYLLVSSPTNAMIRVRVRIDLRRL